MADDSSDTPTPAPTSSKPATPRRRAPRKTSASAASKPATKRKSASEVPAPKRRGSTKRADAAEPSTLEQAGEAVSAATKSVSRTAGAARKRATRAAVDTRKSATRGARSAGKAASRATDKVGGKWGAAAIAGGVAAIGAAATAALLSLRSSTPKQASLPAPKADGAAGAKTGAKRGGAHQPDGTDSTKSFEANIADENTVPE